MLTQKDLDEIEKLVKDVVKEEIKYLPNKEYTGISSITS